tara:strand:- start:3922 stop:5364 length:1443 start_codon:yes stop_codon:yes gene_type:complete
MNFVTQQREHILLSENTGQSRLDDLLNLLNNTITQINIQESLSGNLDFSILSEKGFNKIEEITLTFGDITNIINLPKGLNKLVCSNNLLIGLESLPLQLNHINVSNNYLTNIDLSNLKNLKTLDVKANKIQNLNNLPKTLEELICDSNELQNLNLIDVPDLKILSISNNLITVIEHLPENLTTFNMEDTPSIEFRNTHIDVINITTNKNSNEDKLDYSDALNKFFNYKTKYEKIRKSKLRDIYNNNNSKKLRKKLTDSFKMPCINCKRLVNTTFIYKDDKYIAICGDNNEPCDLAISIYNGQYTTINDVIIDEEEDLLDIKNIIIEQKMDSLFNYIDEDMSNQLFNKQLTAYNLSSKNYNKLLGKYNNIFNNEETKTNISKLKRDIFTKKEVFNDLYSEYKETNNKELLKDAMSIHVNDILPKASSIIMLTNPIYEPMKHYSIAPGNIDDKKQIFSYPFLLNKTDYNLAEEPDVINFTID